MNLRDSRFLILHSSSIIGELNGYGEIVIDKQGYFVYGMHNIGYLVTDDNKILFNADAIAEAVGYSKRSSLDYHVGKRYVIHDGVRYLKVRTINSVASEATRTPKLKVLAVWARDQQDKYLAQVQAAEHIAKMKKPEASIWPYPAGKTVGIKSAAEELSMSVAEFTEWIVKDGFATRYESNNALKWSPSFRDAGYGTVRILQDKFQGKDRQSNVPRITSEGMKYLKKQLHEQRVNGILTFFNAEVDQNRHIEELILRTFEDREVISPYSTAFGKQYKMNANDLISKIKGIVAQVKLKEKK